MIILSFVLAISCNPASEDITDPLWNSLHNAKPFQSDYFHSADYRFPHNACDEPQCHGTNLTGGNSGAPSCYSCHDDQWTIFIVSHTLQMGGYYHRYNVNDYPSDRSVNTNWYIECKTCHGSTLDGNTSGGPSANFAYRYSCKVCHNSLGFTKPVPPPGHTVVMEGNKRHHYNYQSGFSSCSGNACHGTSESSTGNAASSYTWLAGHGPSCDTCH